MTIAKRMRALAAERDARLDRIEATINARLQSLRSSLRPLEDEFGFDVRSGPEPSGVSAVVLITSRPPLAPSRINVLVREDGYVFENEAVMLEARDLDSVVEAVASMLYDAVLPRKGRTT